MSSSYAATIAARAQTRSQQPVQPAPIVRVRIRRPWKAPPRCIPRAGPAGVACDVEATGLMQWHGDEPYAFSFTNEYGEQGYFEWPVDPYTRVVLPNERELDTIRQWAADASIPKVWHNGKYDRCISTNAFGIVWNGDQEDSQWAMHTISSMELSYALKPLAKKFLGMETDDESELKKVTESCRRLAQKVGYMIARVKPAEGNAMTGDTYLDRRNQILDSSNKSATPADYWLVRYFFTDKAYMVGKYCCLDTWRTMGLWLFARSIMDDEPDLWKTYTREKKLNPIIERMERRGVRLDLARCRDEQSVCIQEMEDARAEMMATAWDGFEPTNDGHLRKWLFDPEYHGLTAYEYTEGGKDGDNKLPSVAQPCLMRHVNEPAIRSLFRFNIADNGAHGFFGNYLRIWNRDAVDPSLAVLHPQFKHVEQKTARLACSRPNLQNVPDAISTRSSRPIQGRVPFGPRPCYKWISIDYSQLEIRIFADVSEEPTLLAALAAGRDIHTETANRAWGGAGNDAGLRQAIEALGMRMTTVGGHNVSGKLHLVEEAQRAVGFDSKKGDAYAWDELCVFADRWLRKFDYDIVEAEASVDKKNTRAKAKMVLFCKVFGGGAGAITSLMGVTYEQAKEFLQTYDAAFPLIVDYIRRRTREARRAGYIYNRYGRKLAIIQEKAYTAVNYTVQGSAADLLKIAMIKTDRYLRDRELDAHLLLSIHDELIFEVADQQCTERLVQDLCDLMADHEGAFGVPTPVDVALIRETWCSKDKLAFIKQSDPVTRASWIKKYREWERPTGTT